MHDEHPHALLAQLPLTVSPFVSLPTATPLPYTYKQLPSMLPPSILSPSSSQPSTNPSDQQQPPQDAQPAYITSATGTTATPDAILNSCLALQAHLSQLESNARSTLKEWDERRKAADLAEKRRVAPGWLDDDVKLLVPENVNTSAQSQRGGSGDVEMGGVEGAMGGGRPPGFERRTSVGIKGLVERRDGVPDPREGEELDRVFGGLEIRK
ncbi:hypothetical protein P154DRAFT_557056 [Amniculicola lignicola CBS 123094]|uniref:Uncharacterized protein n=1 Tax=Amniculicola lignicola CBS 123094 TaxID=1392246 RepID=A0A6A5VYR0_9PLEO|nr:hypothetical protein P154DRAFT_557056 [Amniculicola lignicola CBS 123094]